MICLDCVIGPEIQFCSFRSELTERDELLRVCLLLVVTWDATRRFCDDLELCIAQTSPGSGGEQEESFSGRHKCVPNR